MKTQLVIIQPTPLCNIDCRYCYLPNRSSNRRMSTETMARIFRAIFACPSIGKSVRMAWHAGEPLTLPVSFYEEAFDLLARLNHRGVIVKHTFQTNATLVTQGWCDFIKARKIEIGVSVDGPQELHDMNRVDRAGKGTFARTMRGIKLLQENDIPVQVIMVLTRESLERVDEIWNFCMEHGLTRLAFNIEEVEGAHTHSSLQSEGAVAAYQAFLARLSALRDAHPTPVRVRELDEVLARIHKGQGIVQSSLNSPMGILNFDCEGNFSTFSPELLTMEHPSFGSFVFGNVATDSLASMASNEKFIRVHSEIQRGIERCAKSCDYFQLCAGGSPSNKLSENGTFDSVETMYCRLRIQASSDFVLDYLELKIGLTA